MVELCLDIMANCIRHDTLDIDEVLPATARKEAPEISSQPSFFFVYGSAGLMEIGDADHMMKDKERKEGVALPNLLVSLFQVSVYSVLWLVR